MRLCLSTLYSGFCFAPLWGAASVEQLPLVSLLFVMALLGRAKADFLFSFSFMNIFNPGSNNP